MNAGSAFTEEWWCVYAEYSHMSKRAMKNKTCAACGRRGKRMFEHPTLSVPVCNHMCGVELVGANDRSVRPRSPSLSPGGSYGSSSDEEDWDIFDWKRARANEDEQPAFDNDDPRSWRDPTGWRQPEPRTPPTLTNRPRSRSTSPTQLEDSSPALAFGYSPEAPDIDLGWMSPDACRSGTCPEHDSEEGSISEPGSPLPRRRETARIFNLRYIYFPDGKYED